jgi:hypothetical protein
LITQAGNKPFDEFAEQFLVINNQHASMPVGRDGLFSWHGSTKVSRHH